MTSVVLLQVCDRDDIGDYVAEDADGYESVGSSSSNSSALGHGHGGQGKQAAMGSLESSLVAESLAGSRSHLLMALLNDGNATDDSGIDSICCDSSASPSGLL